MSEPTYDLIIVGGGITGAGIARDAVLRGLSVVLFEKGDYASGTSSKSSKLIHGGLRYLEHGEIGLVFESVSERAIQLDVAPHLVRPLPFLVPIYKESKPGLELVNIGLWIYDTLALFRAPKLHKTYRGAKAHELEPLLSTDGLKGAIEYHDCITDDARMVLENILDAADNGAECHSYHEVTSLIRSGGGDGGNGGDGDGDGEDVGPGRVTGVEVRDVLTGEQRRVSGRAVILAAGAWTDETASKLEVDMGRELLRRTKGVHLVFPRETLPLRRAVTLTSPIDGRVMFAIPWNGRTVLGTTDTDFDGTADQVDADPADADYLCDSANRYFPEANFQPEDAIASWAGLRPLISDGDAENEGAVSREHEVFVRDDGVVVIAGGKLTTYRRMAKEVVRATIKWLRRNDEGFGKRELRKPGTKKRPLPGAAGLEERTVDGVNKLAREIEAKHAIDEETALHLSQIYGVRARILAELIGKRDELGLHIAPDLPYVWAEVEFAVQHDLARTIDDVLSRRLPLLLVDREQGLGVLERVATIMAGLLDWSDEERARQVAFYQRMVEASRRFRQADSGVAADAGDGAGAGHSEPEVPSTAEPAVESVSEPPIEAIAESASGA